MPRFSGKPDLSTIQVQERAKRRNGDLGRLHNPCASEGGNRNKNKDKGKGKGNLPYLRFRRKMRKGVFGKAL